MHWDLRLVCRLIAGDLNVEFSALTLRKCMRHVVLANRQSEHELDPQKRYGCGVHIQEATQEMDNTHDPND